MLEQQLVLSRNPKGEEKSRQEIEIQVDIKKMIPSNILNVFNPPTESRPVNEEESCLACQVMGAMTCLAGGAYFMSELPFKGVKNPQETNPTWWKNSVKSAGLVLIGLGVYRGTEGWLWNKNIKYGDSKFF